MEQQQPPQPQPIVAPLPQNSPPHTPPEPFELSDGENQAQLAVDSMLAKQLNVMFLEHAKQKIYVDTTPLAAYQRFDSLDDFLQFNVFTEAIRDRLRGRFWSAKFEGWLAGQLGADVNYKYQMLLRTVPLQRDYQPTPGFIAEDVHFRGVDDFEKHMYTYFFGHEEMLQKVIRSVSQFSVGPEQFSDCLSLVNVATRAFQLLKDEIAVHEGC